MMTTSISHYRPQRTCVACRQVRAKAELIRIVRISEGKLEVDITGKKAGRGAYLCRTEECWETGLKGNRLEHALHTSITPDNREQLIRYGKEHILFS
jgi:predicted RNA-binding protein YlxR (DUF448 family)